MRRLIGNWTFDKFTTITYVMMIAAAPLLAWPEAEAQVGERYCYCSGWECGDPHDPSNFFRWCCNEFPYDCGCSIDTLECNNQT